MREEFAVLKQLDHPHVLRIFEDGIPKTGSIWKGFYVQKGESAGEVLNSVPFKRPLSCKGTRLRAFLKANFMFPFLRKSPVDEPFPMDYETGTHPKGLLRP